MLASSSIAQSPRRAVGAVVLDDGVPSRSAVRRRPRVRHRQAAAMTGEQRGARSARVAAEGARPSRTARARRRSDGGGATAAGRSARPSSSRRRRQRSMPSTSASGGDVVGAVGEPEARRVRMPRPWPRWSRATTRKRSRRAASNDVNQLRSAVAVQPCSRTRVGAPGGPAARGRTWCPGRAARRTGPAGSDRRASDGVAARPTLSPRRRRSRPSARRPAPRSSTMSPARGRSAPGRAASRAR